METIGLLAGIGTLPVEFIEAVRPQGYRVVCIAVTPGVDPRLAAIADAYYDISAFKLDKVIKTLVKEHVKEVTMIGKVTKELLFAKKVLPDFRMMKVLMSLPDRKDDTIMLAFVRELRKEGMEVFDQTALLHTLMPHHGTLTKLEPTEAQRRDMEYGFRVAKELGRLDIGQTVVVKDLAVMALEAIEGTDACIARGGQLARGGAVVVKVAKPQQDSRFDVPTVGEDTLRGMIAVGAKALAIEADRTLVVDRERVAALADANGITIVSMG